MPRTWQEIDGRCHFRHWWQYLDERRITAMTLLTLILTAIALTALAWGAHYLYDLLVNDGSGHPSPHHAPPRSHPADPFESRFA
jgi:hypothetical protein